MLSSSSFLLFFSSLLSCTENQDIFTFLRAKDVLKGEISFGADKFHHGNVGENLP